MRIIRYIFTVTLSMFGILIGIFFLARETYFISDDHYNSGPIGCLSSYWDTISDYFPGYLISILVTVFFSIVVIVSTSRFFFNKSPNIDNYETDYHISNNPFHTNK